MSMQDWEVGLVCPSPVVREGLTLLLQVDGNIAVTWSTSNWEPPLPPCHLIVATQPPPHPPNVPWVLVDQLTSGAQLRQIVTGATRFAPDLTPRERELLTLLARGYSSQQLSQNLHLTPNTIKTHLRGVYRKLRVRDKTQAVLQAFRLGLR